VTPKRRFPPIWWRVLFWWSALVSVVSTLISIASLFE